MASETILVTGCAGFIGSNLVDALLAEGRDVAGIDSFESFYSRGAKERNMRSAQSSPRFQFAELDTRDREGLSAFVTGIKPGTIVDMAARAGVRDSLKNPWLYIDINVAGLQNVLAAAADIEARVVFASSSSIYGSTSELPFREDRVALKPASPYGATKIAGEALVAAHHGLTSLPTGVARLFTVYGPRQRPDLAVRKFAEAMIQGRRIPLYDRGLATRDYTYVGDVVDGIVRLVNTTQDDLTVNLGGGEPHSTLELVRRLEGVFGLTAVIDPMPAQPGDAAHTAADISLAAATLGWTPAMSLDEGLAAFRPWLLAELAEASVQAAASE